MKKTGFSLVEMMVAISIFAVVALISVNAFITADRISKKAQAMKTIIDNLHFALNSISFDLQQGADYHCFSLSDLNSLGSGDLNDLKSIGPSDCTSEGSPGGAAIIFNSPKSSNEAKTIVYKFDTKRIWYAAWNKGGAPSGFVPNYTPITVENLEVNNLQFFVDTSGMPRVFFTIDGWAQLGTDDLRAPFQLQTVVSERI